VTPEVRIAVGLSAGGLRGAAHVGVLRELIRNGVPIDRIVDLASRPPKYFSTGESQASATCEFRVRLRL
jgi:hypothetical protein